MLPQNLRRGFPLIAPPIMILIIPILFLPEFNCAQRGARELGAIKAILTIHQAEVQYKSQFGRYACTLKGLGTPARGPATASAADLIGNDLSSGGKGRYMLTLACSAGGSRTFYSDQTMVIHQNFGAEPATASSPEMK